MTEGPGLAIRTEDLRKTYKSSRGDVPAVRGIDLSVDSGQFFGLLGPNGAGKSTTMRMLTAQALADGGAIEVLGYELPRESKQARMEMAASVMSAQIVGTGPCRWGSMDF